MASWQKDFVEDPSGKTTGNLNTRHIFLHYIRSLTSGNNLWNVARYPLNKIFLKNNFLSDLGNYFLKRGESIVVRPLNKQLFSWHGTCL